MNIPVLILSVLVGLQIYAPSGISDLNNAGPATISGHIIDASSGEELTGVKIRISGADKSVFTDFNGEFEITDLHPGSSYSLEIELVSYRKKIIRNITPGKEPVIIRLSGDMRTVSGQVKPVLPAV